MKTLKIMALMVLLTNSIIAGTESPVAMRIPLHELFPPLTQEQQEARSQELQRAYDNDPQVIELRARAEAERALFEQQWAERAKRLEILRERSLQAQADNAKEAKLAAERSARLAVMWSEYQAKRRAAGIVDGPGIFADLIKAEEVKAQSSS